MAFRGIQSTNIISTDVGLTDPLLILNKDGSTAVDVGFLGKIGATSYAGLVKDSATDEFLLVGSITLSPNTVNDVSALEASLVKGDLSAGTVTATSFVGDGSALTGISTVDWTQASAGTIHASNYTDTNTTYSVGDGGLTQINFTSADNTKLDGIEALADVTDFTTVGAGNGTAALPSLSFSGDTNTGIYLPAADNLGFSTGGVSRGFWSATQLNVATKVVATELDINGDADVSGTVTATSFTGDGSALTGISSTLASLTDSTISSSDPTVTTNPSAVGHLWINSSSGESYVCTDATTNNNIWYNIGGGAGSVSPYVINYLVIAGGGGGGYDNSGGGGAGGYRCSYNNETSGGGNSAEGNINASALGTLTITVGAGGAGEINTATSTGDSGSDSVFYNITSTGGGGGGTDANNVAGSGLNGGSGGGGAQGGQTSNAGSGTANQGYDGGYGGSTHPAGGGGGAGAVGLNVGHGTGGDGLASSITGSAVWRAGGGGAGGSGSHAAGGQGGGGDGSHTPGAGSYYGQHGTANTGGGGGGAGSSGAWGANGGSGVVILRMATSVYSGTTSGSPTVTTDGSDTILTFTGSGSYTA